VSPASSSGPSANFTVTPVNSGSCTVSIDDNHGGQAQVGVTVGPFGPVAPSPTSVSLLVGGSGTGVTVSESNYSGPFFEADSATNPCTSANIATISPSTGSSYTISPGTSAGNCAFVISDDHGQNAEVQVFVTAGSMTVAPNTIQFGDIASGPTPAPFIAQDLTNTGLYTTSVSNPAVASVVCSVPCSGKIASFTVQPLSDGMTSILVSDAAGGEAAVSIGVGEAPLVVRRHALGKPGTLTLSSSFVALSSIGASATIAASEPDFDGPLMALASSPRIATAIVSANGNGRFTITITARGIGTAAVTISDGHSPPRVISVRVAPAPSARASSKQPGAIR